MLRDPAREGVLRPEPFAYPNRSITSRGLIVLQTQSRCILYRLKSAISAIRWERPVISHSGCGECWRSPACERVRAGETIAITICLREILVRGRILLNPQGRRYHQIPVIGIMGRYRSLRSVYVEVAIYLAILLVAPFDHHDLACHLKTPFHCTSCASGQIGLETRTAAVARTILLADAGDVITCQPPADGTLLPVRSTGRSPPPHA
jgi:hypothetical protein